MKIIKNAIIYAPYQLGKKDLLIGAGKILSIEDSIDLQGIRAEIIDAKGKILTPGLIDQHVHITGAGGQQGFASMTPAIESGELVSCGTTTVVGMLGTDGSTKSLQALYAKAKGLEQEGITAYILTSYFAYPPLTFTGSVRDDMLFIDNIIGCKIAISDERSSYPTALELSRLITDVHVAGMLTRKKGILHVHLGGLDSYMGILLELVEKNKVPVRRISPTHVGRTKSLFEEAIRFAKLGGMIDISTGGTKFNESYKQVIYAMDRGVPISQMTFSSDGNAGVVVKDAEGNITGYRKAPVNLNLQQVIKLIVDGGIDPSEAFQLITSNPAKNLSLPQKGNIAVGKDADCCLFDEQFNLCDVMAKGEMVMQNKTLLKK
ncbi:Isoaspartyl dipeptidase [termite gut metagenome]|uniref:Isoaspartyl dipeptidase n=1 Tax=termite gut metagenome TaxID=433724 RepID=A0A5J4S1B2_9ZZZZ